MYLSFSQTDIQNISHIFMHIDINMIKCDTIFAIYSGISCVCMLPFLLLWSGNPIYGNRAESALLIFVACAKLHGWTSHYHAAVCVLFFSCCWLNSIRLFNGHDQCKQSSPSTGPFYCSTMLSFENCSVAYQFWLDNLWMNFEISTIQQTQITWFVRWLNA